VVAFFSFDCEINLVSIKKNRGNMKPNQRGRYNGRYNNNTNRANRTQVIFRNTALESSGPCGKLRGTALQLFEKYQIAAKDALIQNDDVLAETCLQYADHYMHVQNIAIANEQAFRPQQSQNIAGQQRASNEAVAENIALTDGEEGEKNVSNPDEGDVASADTARVADAPVDGALKVLDLSVPVAEMAAKQQENDSTIVPQVQRRRGRPAIQKRVVEEAPAKE
jgi:hypothetical protein